MQYVTLWEDDLSHLKVYQEPLGYAEGSPLTLHNHFIQFYRVLDALFPESYQLFILLMGRFR